MRNKPSRPENMQNKYDENMSKSTALPDMNTTRGSDIVLPPKVEARKSTFRLVFSKINFAMIKSLFETINWPKKKRYENFVSVAL